jgi:hypothetical protein
MASRVREKHAAEHARALHGDNPTKGKVKVEAPGIERSATGGEDGRKRTQTDANGRGSASLSGKMRPFATALRPDATAPVYQVYQATNWQGGDITRGRCDAGD